jgi:hypothetical protein
LFIIVQNAHLYAFEAFGSVRTIRTFQTFDQTTQNAGSDADMAIFSAHPPFAGEVYVVGVVQFTFIGSRTELNWNESDAENVAQVSVHVAPLRYQSLLLYHLNARRVPSNAVWKNILEDQVHPAIVDHTCEVPGRIRIMSLSSSVNPVSETLFDTSMLVSSSKFQEKSLSILYLRGISGLVAAMF